MPKDNPVLNSNEIWKPVVGFESLYEVASSGLIRNMRGKTLKTHMQNSGYLQITLYGTSRVKQKMLVHRVVAEAFIPNVTNKPLVNHIDGDKTNNAISNLEWCTYTENLTHARSLGLNSYNIPTLGLKIGKSSKYYGVTFVKSVNRWQSSIRHEGRNWHQKRFKTEEEAALHYNWIIDVMGFTNRPKNIIR